MTQRDRIIAAALQGTRPSVIAASLDASITTVYGTLSKARREGAPIPLFSTGRLAEADGRAKQEIRFYLDPDTAAALHAEAERRGLRPSVLARDIVTATADDGLFHAVLDDG